MRRSAAILLFLLLLASAGLFAQNNTSSPFSRFGYGELNDNVPVAYRGMGSVGLGMRSNKVINPAQPASYTSVDTTTFMFDVAASAMWSNYGNAEGNRNKANGNLEYLTIQFPFWKYIAFSAGVNPYSSVGYSLVDSLLTETHPHAKVYMGTGGITQVYAGLSFNIMNWVALGANVYYMFGDISNIRSLVFTEANLSSIVQTSNIRVNDFRLRYGLQVFHTFADAHTLVLGGIYEHPKSLNGTFSKIESVTFDTVPVSGGAFGLPMVYGAGLSYSYKKNLTVAADFQMTNWQNSPYFGVSDSLRSRMKFSVGAEYIHNPQGKNYGERMPFRFGITIADSYVKAVRDKDITISIGMGFPLRQAATVLNTTIEYGHRGNATTLQENYLKLSLNVAISETWFFKRKL